MKFVKFTPNEAFRKANQCGEGPFDGIEVEGGHEVVLPERTGPNGWPVCPVVIVTSEHGKVTPTAPGH